MVAAMVSEAGGPPRKKTVDPIVVVGVAGALLFVLLAWFFSRDTSDTKPDGNLTAPVFLPENLAPDAGPAAGIVVDDAAADAILKKDVKSKKAKILQKELAKKRALAKAMPKEDGVIDVVVSAGDGAGALSKVFLKKLTGVRLAASAAHGYFITLRMDSGGNDSRAWVKCSASLSTLPNRALAASLTSRAEIEGSGSDKDDLIRDASDACAADLAHDVSSWIKSR
jgi:hypothetical protein